MVEQSPRYLNLVSAAKIANVTAGTIRYWILTGRLEAEKHGTFWVIEESKLRDTLESRSDEVTEDEVANEA